MLSSEFVSIENLSVGRNISESGFFDIKPRNHCALAYRISGEVEFCVDGEYIKSVPGDVFYMPSDKGYTAKYTDGEIIVLHFNIKENTGKAKNVSCKNSDEIYRLFLKAELLWQEKSPGYRYFTAGVFYEIMGLISEANANNQQPDFFRNTVSEINKSFRDSKISISEICHIHGISETYFRNLFKLYYDTTPIEYITGLRLEYAKNLLYSGYTVELAATMSGFSDAKYFSRVVKKHYGCTPSELKGTRLKT